MRPGNILISSLITQQLTCEFSVHIPTYLPICAFTVYRGSPRARVISFFYFFKPSHFCLPFFTLLNVHEKTGRWRPSEWERQNKPFFWHCTSPVPHLKQRSNGQLIQELLTLTFFFFHVFCLHLDCPDEAEEIKMWCSPISYYIGTV